MNKNSYICNTINEFPDTWEDKIKSKRITIKKDGPLAIFNYGIGANFKYPIVQEARGIIINYETKEVVCWPFRKFTEYDKPYADKIDWSTAHVQEKIDGSIIKLWWNELESKWIFSSNRMIYAKNAIISENSEETLFDIIKRTREYYKLFYHIIHETLDTELTYIFELVNPDAPICIKYQKPMLYHIGTRSNITGKEIYDRLEYIPHPKEYELNSLEDCLEFVEYINDNKSGIIDNCSHEGFVVVDSNWNRIKIKNPIYLVIHDIVSGSRKSIKLLIKLIYENRISIDSICKEFPDISHYIRYYSFKYDELIHEMDSFVQNARKIYNRNNKDKRIAAVKIPECKFKSIAFMALDNDNDIFTLLENRHRGFIGTIISMIPIYLPCRYEFDWSIDDKEENINDNN